MEILPGGRANDIIINMYTFSTNALNTYEGTSQPLVQFRWPLIAFSAHPALSLAHPLAHQVLAFDLAERREFNVIQLSLRRCDCARASLV